MRLLLIILLMPFLTNCTSLVKDIKKQKDTEILEITRETVIGNNRHMVSYETNRRIPKSMVDSMIARQAGKVCHAKGFNGINVLAKDVEYTGGLLNLNLTFECKDKIILQSEVQ